MGVNYVVDDVVNQGGSSYVCKAAHESAANTKPGVGTHWSTFWELVSLGGDDLGEPIGIGGHHVPIFGHDLADSVPPDPELYRWVAELLEWGI